MKLHFDIGVLQQICCMFSEHLWMAASMYLRVFYFLLVCKSNIHTKHPFYFEAVIKRFIYVMCCYWQSWLIQGSPGLNSDRFSVIRLFSIRYSKICKLFFQRFWRIPAHNFPRFLYHLFWELGLHWPFTMHTENVHLLMKLKKYIRKVYEWIHCKFLACEY